MLRLAEALATWPAKLAILFALLCLLVGSRQAPALAPLLAATAVGLSLLLWLMRRLVAGRHRRRWRRAMERHRPALVRRYQQLVRVNDYGAEEFGKWHAELERFRLSAGLPEPRSTHVGGRAAFEDDATALVRRWLLAERQAPEAPVFAGTDPAAYEAHCAELLRRAGWEAELTGGSGDQGVDVLASRDGLVVVVQCKLHRAPVGNKAVQEAHAAMGYEDATHAAVVSTADYTASARSLAAKLGVLLLHHDELPDLARLIGATPGKADRSAPRRRLRSAAPSSS